MCRTVTCRALVRDDGLSHYNKCYCHNDQGAGYTYQDEYGDCAFCRGEFAEGDVICAGPNNVLRICPMEG